MGLETGYQINNPSKQLQLKYKNFSTLKPKFDPYFIIGLIDNEVVDLLQIIK